MAMMRGTRRTGLSSRVGGEHGGITCDGHHVGEAAPSRHPSQTCGLLVGETFDKVMEILAANSFDSANPGAPVEY